MIYGSALHAPCRVPQAPRARRGHDRGAAVDAFEAAWKNDGFLSREHEEARLEAGRAALRRFRDDQLQPGARSRPGSSGSSASSSTATGSAAGSTGWTSRPATRRAGPGHGGRRGPGERRGRRRADPQPVAAEKVVITDYKSSDVRDPAKARQRAKDSLQLTIYAMGYEAMTGRLPDAVALHFLDRASWGGAGRPQAGRRRPARRSGRRRGGSGPVTSSRKPDYLSCTFCAFREICPSSVAR